MLYARLTLEGRPGLCVCQDDRYHPILDDAGKPIDLLEAMAAGTRLDAWAQRALEGPAVAEPRLLPAVQRGGKVLCIGTNYKRHLLEMGLPFPEWPVLFSKFDNALAAHEEQVALPDRGTQFDYEAEMVLVIGKEGKHIPEDRALEHVFGVTCGNDLSVRDLQFLTSQWLLGKTPDGFAPVGPRIRTLHGIDPDDLDISLKRNGKVCQQGTTADMIFSSAHLIHYISQLITLSPGDIIFTGTPEGVINGLPEADRNWLKPGDVLEVELEGVGVLRNRLV